MIARVASFEGVDLQEHKMALSYLHHKALAPPEWRCRARDPLGVSMNLMPLADIDQKAALRGMPPLIKAYLRLGAYFGEGAVIEVSLFSSALASLVNVAQNVLLSNREA